MQDLLGECNEHAVTEEDFRTLFCTRCHNRACIRAGWATSKWDTRIRTQVERLLNNPRFADLRDPKYGRISALDFPDARREALRVHISEELGDWSIPTADDEQLAATGSPTASAVQQAVSALATTEPSKKSPRPVTKKIVDRPPPNTPTPTDGIMVGGPAPTQQAALVDEWAVPVKPRNIIPVGGKVVLGGKKPNG